MTPHLGGSTSEMDEEDIGGDATVDDDTQVFSSNNSDAEFSGADNTDSMDMLGGNGIDLREEEQLYKQHLSEEEQSYEQRRKDTPIAFIPTELVVKILEYLPDSSFSDIAFSLTCSRHYDIYKYRTRRSIGFHVCFKKRLARVVGQFLGSGYTLLDTSSVFIFVKKELYDDIDKRQEFMKRYDLYADFQGLRVNGPLPGSFLHLPNPFSMGTMWYIEARHHLLRAEKEMTEGTTEHASFLRMMFDKADPDWQLILRRGAILLKECARHVEDEA